MTYPPQPGTPGSWPDQSWPTPDPYQDPAMQASGPAAYEPYSAPPEYTAGPAYPQPGYPQPAVGQPYPMYGMPTQQPTNGMAVASLVLSLSGLLFCGLTSIVGAILGHVARKQIAERGGGGDGLALAGIIVGWILFGLAAVGLLFYVFLFAAMLSADSSYDTTEYGNVLLAQLS